MLLLLAGNAAAQKQGQQLVDSLLGVLPAAKEDTMKVNILNQLAYTYFFINSDNGIKYGAQALQLARSLNWKNGMATAYKNIGNAYMNKAENDTALILYANALAIFEQTGNKDGQARALGNIAGIYDTKGDFARALEYALKALRIYQQLNDQRGLARVYGVIGNLYEVPQKYAEALHYDAKALEIHKRLADSQSIAIDMGNIGNVYYNLKDYKNALEYDFNALRIFEQLKDTAAIANKLLNIAYVYTLTRDYALALDYHRRALKMYETSGDKQGIAGVYGNLGSLYLKIAKDTAGSQRYAYLVAGRKENIRKALEYSRDAHALFKEVGDLNALQAVCYDLSEIYDSLGDYKSALNAYSQFSIYRDSLTSASNKVKFANLEKQLAIEEKTMAEKEKAAQVQLNQLTIAKNRNATFLYVTVFCFLLTVVGLSFRQRKLSDNLLFNILPRKIVTRLKRKEFPIADHFDGASIMFVDIVGFTKYCDHKDPKIIINMLNEVFTIFDALAGKHGLEKIKTIGDCYMAVAGLPEPNPNHAIAAAEMALELRATMAGFTAPDGAPVHFRIGLDSGRVVAGVIGKKKFIYDIWGDAVNTASRMESSGVADEIHCSDTFKQSIENSYTFTDRGVMNIKSKGNMRTWLLTGRQSAG